jgi:cellulose synthase/poly-beta-1,6-N-acetylglucosamine synthase-like glycosyltransferase
MSWAVYLFWTSTGLVAYAYVGYPALLWLRRCWCNERVHKKDITPPVSIVIAAHNEAALLPRKLKNLSELRYPRPLLEIIVVSDGSSDETEELLKAAASPSLRPVLLSERAGKAVALNEGMAVANGVIVVFMDVRQEIEADAIAMLVRNFADSTVGCVSGELMLKGSKDESGQEGLGFYWSVEKAIRKMESETGSVVGATGALYAARRELLPHIPQGMLLDDVYVPLCIAAKNKRVVFEPEARAWDEMPHDLVTEFRRKVRTLTGNYQLVELAPWLLSGANPLRFQFISHKLLRLLVPFALAALLVSSIFLEGPLYRTGLVLQSCFYASAAVALFHAPLGLISRLGRTALAFLLLNLAAVLAFVNFISGKRTVWVRP